MLKGRFVALFNIPAGISIAFSGYRISWLSHFLGFISFSSYAVARSDEGGHFLVTLLENNMASSGSRKEPTVRLDA